MTSEGLIDIKDLLELDKEGIKDLYNSVSKPGNIINDPNNLNQRITNPGHKITTIPKKNLKAKVYTKNIHSIIGRNINLNTISRIRLHLLENNSKIIEYNDYPKMLPAISWTFGIIKAIEIAPSHLHDKLVISMVCLSSYWY